MNEDHNIDAIVFSGEMSGIREYTIFGRSVKSYYCPRDSFLAFSKIKDAKNHGVYLLINYDDVQNTTIYVGESENITQRINNHYRTRKDEDNWTEAIVFLSPGNVLTIDVVRYLECELIKSINAKQFKLLNKVTYSDKSFSPQVMSVTTPFVQKRVNKTMEDHTETD